MTANTTPIGTHPAASIERLDDGRVLVCLLNRTDTHYCVLMQVYSADLTLVETVLQVKYPFDRGE